ncbi:MAG TPA: TRAP transporter substrate-binding protein [Chromobacteriaceae bacterium]|nr:TRAP transporter substrate-binding protein [Chromobacteriaceae bacterium]
MKLKQALAMAVLVLGWLGLPACASAEIIIRFSHVVAPDTPKGKAAAYFKKLAESRTGGKVRVLIYPNSQLYKDKDELEALQLGAVQMLAPSLAKFGPLGIKEFEVFDLPYLFDDYRAVNRVLNGSLGSQLLGRLESKGIKGLAYWDNGFKNFSANHPIRRPGDLKGLKIRVQPSKVLEEEIRAVGGQPQIMAFSDVYQALRAGVVDGAEMEGSNFYTSRAYQVQKHLTLTNHGFLGYAVIVNKKFWDGLPSDIRRTLEGAMQDATRYANDIAKQENDKALASIRASGKTVIYTPTAQERAAFKRALWPVHARMASRIGPGLLQAIYRETGFRPGH